MCAAIATLAATAAFAASHDGPPLDLLDENIRGTPYSAYVQIESVQVAHQTNDSRSGKLTLITFRIRARVVETIKGTDYAHIEYLETREVPSEVPQSGASLVVSLEAGSDGVLFVPDNGYVFPATPEVLRRARKLIKLNK